MSNAQRITPIINNNKITKTTSDEKITTTNIPLLAKRATTNLSPSVVKNSYQIGRNASESIIPRKIPSYQRSNSNSSIISNSSLNQGNRKVKETASKIATLWKKVEEKKGKQRYEKPDTKQWITPRTRDLTRGNNHQSTNLFRSSTFEGIIFKDA